MDNKKEIALQTLERYSGSKAKDFRSNLIITNFPKYVQYFAKKRGLTIFQGKNFDVAHSAKEDISIVDFKIGSPAAALVIDVCSFLPIDTCIFLGMCGGLRKRYKIGDYLVPVAAIRKEGTSDYYFPKEVPAIGNFLIQKAIVDVLEEKKSTYHIGITYTTNKRFWEFDEKFKEDLQVTKAQSIEMECATLFAAGYKRQIALGALLLISDLPLNDDGIKTKESEEKVFEQYTEDHVEKGVQIIQKAKKMKNEKIQGFYI